ncbi:MAG TPA: helix-turn-helix domain-containing protein [Hyphomicrobiaceae bacterium]|nr:helix-turn-helix domain-containing protein [Hyphomicrobiaceae bacterium]
MKEGPDISRIAALIGNPACANMLMALMPGPALTVTELAGEAGLGLPAVSSYLSRLEHARLVAVERQGRHRYFRLANADVVTALEGLLPLAARAGHIRARLGPRDPDLKRARSCYDHLAGALAVQIFDSLVKRGLLAQKGETVHATERGRRFFAQRGIELNAIGGGRRPLCATCLDWSERRSHLRGALGASLFQRMLVEKWAARSRGSRVVRFSRDGEAKILAWLAV